jgi:hypothetical protein
MPAAKEYVINPRSQLRLRLLPGAFGGKKTGAGLIVSKSQSLTALVVEVAGRCKGGRGTLDH